MSRTPNKQLATNIRVEMARAGLRHNELAERIAMMPAAMSKRLQGRVQISATELVRVADALGVPESVLLSGISGRSADNSGKHTVSPARATVTPEADADGPTRDQSARLPRDAA